MTRLFVAAWPPPEVAESLARLADLVDDGVRSVPMDHLHVTLGFIGDADVDTVAERLERADLNSDIARLGPELIRLGGRQIVVPVAGADALAAVVLAATEGLGQQSRHDFFGHMTLARARRGAVSTIEGARVGESFALDDIRLVESHLEPTGAVYTTIERFPVR